MNDFELTVPDLYIRLSVKWALAPQKPNKFPVKNPVTWPYKVKGG